MCFVKLTLWSMVILRCFTSLLLFIFSTINVKLLLFIDDLKNIIWNFPGLATMLLIRNQFRTISVSLDNFRCASSKFNEHEYKLVSSVKLQTSVSLTKNLRSFMKRFNKSGPNIDPCRTPPRISRYTLKVHPIFTR